MSTFGMTTTRTENFSEWYRQLIIKGNLIEYYDVSGCYVFLPNSYFVWEQIQAYLNTQFAHRKVQNTYFPLFITKRNLEKESSHIEGFAPEVAWVTETGHKKRTEDNYLAIRPTSECAIYPIFAKLISNHTHLPLKYNQWANVVRWEFKDPMPFIRSREFLWQEGHTCHRTRLECVIEMCDILNVYSDCYRDLLAVPVIKGYKTEKEKFAGAEATLTIEGYLPVTGRGIQCATSHCLGDNFSKIFNITYEDKSQETKLVYQNSWGFTTRSIGVMLMTHSDDIGIIFPHKVAPLQIVIIPVIYKNSKTKVLNYAQEIGHKLSAFRVRIDDRNFTLGYKNNEHELAGVPLRIEVGPRDLQNQTLRYSLRHQNVKIDIPVTDELSNQIATILDTMHHDLYTRAQEQLHNAIVRTYELTEFSQHLSTQKFCLAPFCGSSICEDTIKETTGAKSLCVPFENNDFPDAFCVVCRSPVQSGCLFGVSF